MGGLGEKDCSRKGWMQGKGNAVQEGCRTGEMQESKNSGLVGCRAGRRT